MRNTKIVLLTVLILGVCLIWMINHKPVPGSKSLENGPSYRRVLEDGTIVETVRVTQAGSRTIEIKRKLNIRWIAGQGLPIIIHYNGGEGNGGWNVSCPPYVDWGKENFTPPTYGDALTQVSFSVGPGFKGEAWVECWLKK